MDLPPNAPRRKCDRYILHPDELKSILKNLQNETENKQNGRQRRESESKNSKDPFRGYFSLSVFEKQRVKFSTELVQKDVKQ